MAGIAAVYAHVVVLVLMLQTMLPPPKAAGFPTKFQTNPKVTIIDKRMLCCVP